MPRYSIITPTILRPSLVELWVSVVQQSCKDWEWIVAVDADPGSRGVPNCFIHNEGKIKVIRCEHTHKNYGNTCRHNAWNYATGDYIMYLDDDVHLADDKVLEDLKCVTAPWAIFPIIKKNWGGMHFFCPPFKDFTDAGSMLIQREFGRYLDIPDHNADGQLVEQLRSTQPYQALLFRPLVIKPYD